MVSAFALAVGLILSRATPTPQSETARGLVVQYADGRRTVTAIDQTPHDSWTPAFPRIPGADTSHDGLPLFAMQYEVARDEKGLAVTVALLYGRPNELRVPVETVHVSSDAPVRVAGLEAFGVKPIQFSIVSLAPAQLVLPSVTTPSSYFETFVETSTDPVPAYFVTIVNHSSRDAMMIAFTAFQGTRPGLTGRPRGRLRTALIPAGDNYVLRVRASTLPGRGAAPPAWVPIDRISITSVLWSDDVVEGDGEPAADEHALDSGTALQLDRILTLLRGAAANPAAHAAGELRASLASLSLAVTPDEVAAAADAIPGAVHLPAAQIRATMADGMRNARSAVLNDLDDWLQAGTPPRPAEYAVALTQLMAKYAGWRSRIAPSL